MPDNITAPAAGLSFATDEIGGVHYPRTKLSIGADGTAADVSTANRLPVALPDGFATAAKQDELIAAIEGISPGGGSGGDASAANQVTGNDLLADILAALGATLTVDGTVEIGASALAALETTELGATSLAALESITANVAGVATEAKQDAQVAAIATIGTRAYGPGQQVAVGATSAASTGLAATEVLLHASTRCFVRVATAATAAAGIPLEAGEKFHLRLNSGQQIHVIRDTADGFLNIVPVA